MRQSTEQDTLPFRLGHRMTYRWSGWNDWGTGRNGKSSAPLPPAAKEARAVLLENLINSPADQVCGPSDRPGKADPDSWKLSDPLQQHRVTKEVLLREYQTAVNAADFNDIIVARGKRRSSNDTGPPTRRYNSAVLLPARSGQKCNSDLSLTRVRGKRPRQPGAEQAGAGDVRSRQQRESTQCRQQLPARRRRRPGWQRKGAFAG